MIPEREREALMRLTMCARGECAMCKYEKRCTFAFQYEIATENMNILADVLRKVVRCEECIHNHEHGDCPINWAKADDDYCSYGERMGGE